MIVIRNFSPSDISDVMLLVTENFNQDYRPGFYLSMHSLWADGFIVAKKGGRLVGLLLGSLGDKCDARILIMVVDKSERYSGIGSALIREFIGRCSLHGLKMLALEVRVSNEAARRFYARFGFQRVTIIENYYLDGENAYQLAKWL